MSTVYITTAIPYVNAPPHAGHALELVLADVLVRHRRERGDRVRFCSGTDDNALKNVTAAEDAGVPVQTFVDDNAGRFVALCHALEISTDDFIRTSIDPRHGPAVEKLWRACAASGDIYRGRYEGLYCAGCEAFVDGDDLEDGRCLEHRTEPEQLAEENWFFRLSGYADRLADLIDGGELVVRPRERRNEVLRVLHDGLKDVSISRPAERGRGWGVRVPGDPTQTVYVWFDALANYIAALGYGTGGPGYEQWWTGSDARVHVIGKGILRFHALLWPAALLSAGEPLPTTIAVHGYLTAGGRKLSKSSGTAVDPLTLIRDVGVDAVRWWLLRAVPRGQDADIAFDRVTETYNHDLADTIGNTLRRVAVLKPQLEPGGEASLDETRRPGASGLAGLEAARCALPSVIDNALAELDPRRACEAISALAGETNRLLERERPWERVRGGHADRDRAAAVVAAAERACATIARELSPFLPSATGRLGDALLGEGAAFPRIG